MPPDWTLYRDLDMSNPAAYGSSKAGLNYLTKWLASTLSPKIRVNSVSPGGILRKQHHKFIERYNKKVPLGRWLLRQILLVRLFSYLQPMHVILQDRILELMGVLISYTFIKSYLFILI